jgi:hypothetical protein
MIKRAEVRREAGNEERIYLNLLCVSHLLPSGMNFNSQTPPAVCGKRDFPDFMMDKIYTRCEEFK